MSHLILKDEIIKAIKDDPTLFAEIAVHLDTTIRYGLVLVDKNDPKLTQAGVLRIIRKRLGIKSDSALLEEQTTAA